MLAAVLALACDCGRESGDPVLYRGGISREGVYQSSDWHGPWLHFPGGRRYLLVHGLGEAPAVVTTYLAFSEYPTTSGKTGDLAEASGSAAQIEAVSAEHVQVRNQTCSEFYLRVVAQLERLVPDQTGP